MAGRAALLQAVFASMKKMNLYFSVVDAYPPFRVDVADLFGDYLAKKNLQLTWFMQREQSGSSGIAFYHDQHVNLPPGAAFRMASWVRRTSRSKRLASSSASTNSVGRLAMWLASSAWSSPLNVFQASGRANFSTERRCGRTTKFSTFMAATTWCRWPAVLSRNCCWLGCGPYLAAGSLTCFPSMPLWSSSSIRLSRALNKRVPRDSPALPSVVSGFWLKNSRFWQ